MMTRTIVISIGLGLLLLCACTQQSDPTAVPTDMPTPTDNPVPTPPPSPPPVLATVHPTTGPQPADEPGDSVTVGEPLTYTLTVTNYGPSDATDVTITDTLPAGVILDAATPSQGSGCLVEQVGDLSHISCKLGDLRLGASARITIVVTPMTVTDIISHTAIVVGAESDPDLLDNLLYEETKLSPIADLAIQAWASAPVIAGGRAIYTLTVTNAGPAPATGVILTDVLPIGVMLAWSSPGEPRCGRSGQVVGCDLGHLKGGDAATVTLDLSVHVTDTITTTMPAGMKLDLSAATCAVEQDDVLPYLKCRLDDLASGVEAQVVVGVRIDTWMTGTITHTATVAAAETDPVPSDNSIAVTTTVSAATPLGATMTPMATDLLIHADAPERVVAGRPFTYTFIIVNQGQDATEVTFQNILPPGITLEASSPGWPLCNAANGAITCHLNDPDSDKTITFTLVVTSEAEVPPNVTLDPAMPGWPLCNVKQEGKLSRAVNCNLGALQSDAETKITLTATAGGLVTRVITNTATVTAGETDSNPANNSIEITTTVSVEADLAVHSETSGPVLAGERLKYTLTITNAGPSDATGVILTATLPVSTTFVSVSPSQGSDCQFGGETPVLSPTITCHLGRLDNDMAATVAITVTVGGSVIPPTVKTIAHSAIVVADPTDPNQDNNQVTQSIPVSTETDLFITEP